MIASLARFLLRPIPMFVVALVVAEIILTNELAGLGQEVGSLETHIDALKEENQLLREQTASASSLLTIAAQAQMLGFRDATPHQFLSLVPEQFPVALNQSH
jgi:cell division protein FtsL